MPSDKDSAGMVRSLGALSAVGLGLVFAVVIGALVGYGIDRLTGLWARRLPIFSFVFFFVGVAAGIANVVRTYARYNDEQRPTKPR